jgi:hypothetical protein
MLITPQPGTSLVEDHGTPSSSLTEAAAGEEVVMEEGSVVGYSSKLARLHDGKPEVQDDDRIEEEAFGQSPLWPALPFPSAAELEAATRARGT